MVEITNLRVCMKTVEEDGQHVALSGRGRREDTLQAEVVS